MHNAALSFLIYLLYLKNSYPLNRCELDPYEYDVFNSKSALELNPDVVTFTSGIYCICICIYFVLSSVEKHVSCVFLKNH